MTNIQQPTKALAKFAAELTYDKIPAEAVQRIKLCLLEKKTHDITMWNRYVNAILVSRLPTK